MYVTNIENGDVVRICPCEQYQVGDIVVCVDINGVRYIHRIYEIADGKYITKADNNLCIDGNPITYDKIFGKVVMWGWTMKTDEMILELLKSQTNK